MQEKAEQPQRPRTHTVKAIGSRPPVLQLPRRYEPIVRPSFIRLARSTAR